MRRRLVCVLGGGEERGAAPQHKAPYSGPTPPKRASPCCCCLARLASCPFNPSLRCSLRACMKGVRLGVGFLQVFYIDDANNTTWLA